jgi:hypothetical protein
MIYLVLFILFLGILNDLNATGFGAAILASNFSITTDNIDYNVISPSPEPNIISLYQEKYSIWIEFQIKK